MDTPQPLDTNPCPVNYPTDETTPRPVETPAMPPAQSPDILGNPYAKGALATGGVGAAIVAVLMVLAQFGVIGEGAQQKEAAAEAARRATEESLVEMKMQLADIRRSLEEIKRSGEDGLRRADFELWAERAARLNPTLQLPPPPAARR